ncbi:acetate kinase [Alkalilimnicola ehrlichii]|uniref:Acetate kinase n=1 Tax=Alkalilimnicola ehrlichii TaxID=351052 RepID=A0A3E0X112_9GAMM|nr:acetate kinase [Alkalilimnicola ehrlichii]RFA31417.1 acetate kinase [Alkalilimnicola ehrlichii]RFA39311.1 acetate kinase [Alkalilimnicola ehrlichii]
MQEAILVLNAGSSSIKFAIYALGEGDSLTLRVAGQAQGIPERPGIVMYSGDGEKLQTMQLPRGADHEHALSMLTDFASLYVEDLEFIACGHRVVHGGTDYAEPVLIDHEVYRRLERLIPLAPLHQPHNLRAVKAFEQLYPTTPQIACFDTAFHRTQPAVAQAFALPHKYTEQGVLRYGFHGLSYEYIAQALHGYDKLAATGRVVVAHLGNGASMCAISRGQSIATSMGFTALDGLPMGQRCGNIDPGVVLYLMQNEGMSVEEVEELLYRRSGLLGMSGISSDMRELLDKEDDPRACRALDVYTYRAQREIGSLVAALRGMDALVFTAGVGENAPAIREWICQDLTWLGVYLDHEANDAGEARISTEDSPVSVWVIPTDEELMIARHTLKLVRQLPRR